MMVVELLASHTYVPSKCLFRKKIQLTDCLIYYIISKYNRQFFRNACSNMVFYSHWVTCGKRTIRQPGRNNQKVTTIFFSVQTLRCFHSCFNVAANGSNRVWERMYQVVVLVKMWRLFGCSFQIVGRSVCDRRPDEKKKPCLSMHS